jgi:U3 small nucleolar RNA-associated protein 12
MVKTYLKYQLKDVIGQISGKSCQIFNSSDGKYIYTGCNEYVLVIDSKTGLVVKKIIDSLSNNNKSTVTCVISDQTDSNLAVGYTSGVIVIYDIKNDYFPSKRFSLHKSAITSLEFNKNMNILASGSNDTNIFIWDIIGESVLFKLTGHKDSINKVMFYTVQTDNFEEIEILVSSSKDNTIKVWNVKNQETLQTIADLVHKVTDFLIYDDVLILGSFDQKIRLYQFNQNSFNKSSTKDNNYFVIKGHLTRQSNSKIISISLSKDSKLISILSKDNSVEFFKILSPGELKKRLIKNELEKTKKTEKREKLLAKDKYTEVETRVKNLMEQEEYNYKFKYYSLFKFIGESKISSHVCLTNHFRGVWKFCNGLSNNSLEIYELKTNLIDQSIFFKKDFSIEEKNTDEESLTVNKSFAIDSYGHREILRFVKISEKDNLFVTASNDSVRLWNMSSLNVIKNISINNIITAEFILEDKYVRS